MKELTQRQGEVLVFIKTYIKQHNYPPTIREIAERFAISVKGAYDHVSALKKKGFIISDKRSRTIKILNNQDDEPDALIEAPILGQVAAGSHALSEENWDGAIAFPKSWLKEDKRYFVVTVRGDSMIGAGILDGDQVLVEQAETVENGEIVVVMVNETMTLKRYFREQSRVRLQPENDKYQPIFAQDIKVLGRVSKVIRYY